MAGPVELVESATVGLAVGTAAADAFEPTLESAKQTAWTGHKVKVLDPATAAQLVAQGLTDSGTAYDQAARQGYSSDKVDALVQIALRAPGVSEGLTLLRRGYIAPTDFQHICQKAMLEPGWEAALVKLQQEVLSPPDVALGMVRNNIANADASGQPIFPGGLDSTGSTVPQHGYAAINAETEAAASGYDLDRFTVLANNVGLPPGVIEGLNMLNRGYITEADFALLIEQSDTRIAWGPFILKLREMLLSPHEIVEARLRNWITDDATMYAGTAQHGLSQANTDLLFELTGRPIPVHQVTKGAAYLADNGGSIDLTDEETLAVEQSNVRPPWYQLDVAANRYAWPGYFVLKALTPGTITVDRCAAILRWSGWEPDLAMQTAQSFAAGSGTGGNKHITSSTTSLVTAARKAYIGGAATEAEARQALDAANVDPATQDQLVALWNANKTLEALSPV